MHSTVKTTQSKSAVLKTPSTTQKASISSTPQANRASTGESLTNLNQRKETYLHNLFIEVFKGVEGHYLLGKDRLVVKSAIPFLRAVDPAFYPDYPLVS